MKDRDDGDDDWERYRKVACRWKRTDYGSSLGEEWLTTREEFERKKTAMEEEW